MIGDVFSRWFLAIGVLLLLVKSKEKSPLSCSVFLCSFNVGL